MECTVPSNSSHGWRDIIAGRDLLKIGLGKHIGSGETTNLWTSPWLSLDEPTRPYGPPTLATLHLNVSDLRLPNSTEWNLEAIRIILPHHEDQIKLLPRSRLRRDDTHIWLPSPKGEYSSKSGYSVITMKEAQTEHASFNWQRFIWRLKTIPKIKHLLWKGAVNALPVGDQLVRRGIDVNSLCKRCGCLETIEHVFRDCSFAQEVWNLAPYTSNISEIQGSFLHLLSETKDLVVLPPAGISEAHLCAWIFWFLWKARNELIFAEHTFAPSEVLLKAVREARSWQEAQTHKEKPLNAPSSNLSIKKHTHGFYCHVDAAWNSSTLQCGMGWKILSYGNPLISFSGQEVAHSIPSALSAEALALRTTILAANAVSCEDIHFFSDNSTIVQLLRSLGDHKEIHFLLKDIRDSTSLFNFFEIGNIPRLENVEADLLAKNALRGSTSEFKLS